MISVENPFRRVTENGYEALCGELNSPTNVEFTP
jgi:hypothetical protein